MAKSINGWSQGTMKKPTDDRTMPDVPRHFVRKCLFCDGHEGHYTGITETMHIEIAEYLGMDAKMIGNVIRDTPELKKIIDKSRRDFSQIIIYDRNNGDYTLVRTMYSAARKVGLNTASIKFYVNDRHCNYWIHNRYKVKRKVWFDEDNGM